MKNIKFLIGAFVLVVIITLTVNYFSNTENSPVVNVPTSNEALPSYTLAEVAKHGSTTSCFSIVGKNVHDLTSWISKHPGGAEAITGICGKDATAVFAAQHGGQSKPENKLESFIIGTYKK